MRNAYLSNMFLTNPCYGASDKVMDDARSLTNRYIHDYILAKPTDKVVDMITNRFANLLMAGQSPKDHDIHITDEMEVALYKAMQEKQEEADEYVFAFLSYRISSFIHRYIPRAPRNIEDIVMSMYFTLYRVIRQYDDKGTGKRISNAYLDRYFLEDLRNESRILEPLSMSDYAYRQARNLRKNFNESMEKDSIDETIRKYNEGKKAKERIPYDTVYAAKQVYISCDVTISVNDNPWKNEYDKSLEPCVTDNHDDLKDEMWREMTIRHVGRLDDTIPVNIINAVIDIVEDYSMDHKRRVEKDLINDVCPKLGITYDQFMIIKMTFGRMIQSTMGQ